MKTGKIYKIISKSNPDIIYIGSTVQKLKVRLSKHKHDYKRYNEGRYNYVTSFKLIKCGDYEICLLEEVQFTERCQLNAIEAKYIRNNKSCVNKIYSY